MDCKRVTYSRHAIERMFERSIAESDVVEVLRDGIMIEEYPNETPYPCMLLLGVCGGWPLHVVVAYDIPSGLCIVITTYIADVREWGEDYKTRRRR